MTGVHRSSGPVMLLVITLLAGLELAPSAHGDPADVARKAMVDARGSLCAPFGADPLVQRVTEVINTSIDAWLDHTTASKPIEDPLPGLKELGYDGSKAVSFGGANSTSSALAIKAALLEGYAAIPDCSYTDLGVSLIFNEATGQNLVAVVLAGP